MSSRPRSLAFTLLETLLAAGLLLVVIILASEVLLPMARGARRGSQQIHLQQLAQLALDRLANDLSCAPLDGVTQDASSNVLSVQRLGNVTARGGQIWADRLSVYWLDASTARLWHREWPPNPPIGLRPFAPDVPYEPTPGELQQIVSAAGGTARVLTPNVTVWLVDLSAQPPTVRLRVESQGETFELSRRVVQRNRRF